MNGYLDAISDQSITISLGGRDILLLRARLGLHLQLSRLVQEFEQAPGWSEIASAIQAYFGLLGVDIAGDASDEGQGRHRCQCALRSHPVEVLAAFYQLKEANRWQWALAFMREPKHEGGKSEPYDYPERNWAWVVHKLSSRYGWTRHYIMELWPEEAACYLQEIMVSEANEAEERHSLSELAYRYDSASKTSKYIPLPRPEWMVSGFESPGPVRMLRSLLPYGAVINLETGETIHYN